MLKEDTDAYPDLALLRNDAVPFSCCARSILSSCIHQNLIQLGTSTINKNGCVKKLLIAVHLLLWCEMFIYGICLGLEVQLCIKCNVRVYSPLPFTDCCTCIVKVELLRFENERR